MPVVLMLIAVPVMMVFGFLKNKQRDEAWRAAGQRLALRYEAGGALSNRASLTGPVGPCQVSVDLHSRGSGKNQQLYTRYRLNFVPVGPPLTLTRETWGRNLLRRVTGGQDMQIGDAAFDDSVRITGSDEVSVAAYLSPARRTVVLHLLEAFSHVIVSERSVSVERRGAEGNAERLVNTVLQLVDASAVLSAPTSVDQAIERQSEGDLGSAFERLAEVPPSVDGHPNRMARRLEAEARLAAGDGPAARAALDDVAAPGEDPQVDGWRRAAAHPAVAAPDVVPTAPVAAGPLALDAASVIADLFGGGRASWEVEDWFNDTYRGAGVVWSGTVKRVREFHYDMVFSGTGQRAVVTIGQAGDGRIITNDVDAIVQLDHDIELHEGDHITFEGTLVRLDRFVHNLFVAEARLR